MRRGLIYSVIFIISLYSSSFLFSERYSSVDIDSSTVPSEKQESVEKPGLGNPVVHRLQDNVFAVTGLYHSSGGRFGTNAGIIFTKNSVIFIDSGMSIASGEFLWKTAQEKMKGNENLYLILTHHHSDHVFGMRVMEEKGAQVIAHKLVEGEFIEMDGEQYKRFLVERSGWSKEQGDLIFGDVVLSQPDVLVEKDTVLNIDGEEIHILVTPGHVPDELSVYHPGSRTLFAGDAIYEGSRLTTRFGGPEEWKLWISHLERFKKLDIAIIVPG
ncbi:MAG: MBL fold metallo-hydrolase, partial [Candidatus Aminicenantes bacterium]|nr:MBL fold metallo-hydrolase [Candidatus Aminicenantes bacterium]